MPSAITLRASGHRPCGVARSATRRAIHSIEPWRALAQPRFEPLAARADRVGGREPARGEAQRAAPRLASRVAQIVTVARR